MKLHIIAAALPPRLDGIGDHTALLAAELAKTVSVQVLTSHGQTPDAIPGVVVTPAFAVDDPKSCWGLLPIIEADRPDWVLLQYNPFCYGRRGLNLHLPEVMRQVRRRCPDTKLAVMVHEMFVPFRGWKFMAMSPWQRWQFWRLAGDADVMFFSVGGWADTVRPWRRGRPTLHLPVGSNIPRVPITRAEARARLGIAENTVVLGLFGSAHVSRMLPWVRDAARAVCRAGHDTVLLYVGPDAAAIRAAIPGVPLLADGPFPPEEVSRRFAAMDIHLAPFTDGVSTRRGTLMAALQHGIATVGTDGHHTDEVLRRENGKAFLLTGVLEPKPFVGAVTRLAEDEEAGKLLGRKAKIMYSTNFEWNVLAERLQRGVQGAH